ncbi:MAG: DUF4124 domain-containing protein [Gammaproteobacteria bacterium]|nr:DUF4124 domain-containing protein [Gammaproteobacteria bacterium]
MKNLLTIMVLVCGASLTANADVWSWTDATGMRHFVDTNTPIYTWVDEFGKSHYSDTPEHEDAVSVELIWHSKGSLSDVESDSDDEGGVENPLPGETPEEFAQRKAAEAYYCEQATKIYESYVNAPQLYRTGEDGAREYLSKEDAAEEIAATRARKDELCS